MEIPGAQERLGLLFSDLEKHTVPIGEMLQRPKELGGLGEAEIDVLKDEIFQNIAKFIEGEGYPGDHVDFMEANVHDLVYTIVNPVLVAVRRATKRKLRLCREKRIVSTDAQTGGRQEFVGVDAVGVGGQKFIFVVEAKRYKLQSAKMQCMLALRDMADNNRDGQVVYGFITTGDFWQVIRYQHEIFTQTDPIQVVFRTMERNKAKWLKESSIIVDFLHAALRSEGFVAA